MKKSVKIFILSIFFIFLITSNIFASTLNLDLSTSSKKIKKNDEFEVTVDWKEGMQAVDFNVEYDNDKLEFIGMDLGDDFYNDEDGKVRISWFSAENEDKTSVKLKFKALKNGKTEIKTNVRGGFADRNLKRPDKYENGKLEITVGSNNVIIIVSVIAVLLIVFDFIKNKLNKKIKKERKK